MCKPKVQSLIAFVSRRGKIVLPLLLAHSIPPRGSLLVDSHVEQLGPNHHSDIEDGNADEHAVAPMVVRGIVLAVDVDADDVRGLDTHVVDRRGNRAGADTSSIAGCNGNKDGVEVGHAEYEHRECVVDPVTTRVG